MAWDHVSCLVVESAEACSVENLFVVDMQAQRDRESAEPFGGIPIVVLQLHQDLMDLPPLMAASLLQHSDPEHQEGWHQPEAHRMWSVRAG